jgi:hypothetical protein
MNPEADATSANKRRGLDLTGFNGEVTKSGGDSGGISFLGTSSKLGGCRKFETCVLDIESRRFARRLACIIEMKETRPFGRKA